MFRAGALGQLSRPGNFVFGQTGTRNSLAPMVDLLVPMVDPWCNRLQRDAARWMCASVNCWMLGVGDSLMALGVVRSRQDAICTVHAADCFHSMGSQEFLSWRRLVPSPAASSTVADSSVDLTVVVCSIDACSSSSTSSSSIDSNQEFLLRMIHIIDSGQCDGNDGDVSRVDVVGLPPLALQSLSPKLSQAHRQATKGDPSLRSESEVSGSLLKVVVGVDSSIDVDLALELENPPADVEADEVKSRQSSSVVQQHEEVVVRQHGKWRVCCRSLQTVALGLRRARSSHEYSAYGRGRVGPCAATVLCPCGKHHVRYERCPVYPWEFPRWCNGVQLWANSFFNSVLRASVGDAKLTSCKF